MPRKRANINKGNKGIPIVEVTWRDAAGSLGWVDPVQYERFCKEETVVKTFGFLVKADTEAFVVSQNVAENSIDGGLGNLMRIPRPMVTNVKTFGFYKSDKFKIEGKL